MTPATITRARPLFAVAVIVGLLLGFAVAAVLTRQVAGLSGIEVVVLMLLGGALLAGAYTMLSRRRP